MKKPVKTMVVKVERTIPAAPKDVFAAWLNPKVPGTPWSEAKKLILNPEVDGFFYWLFDTTPHYGRFMALKPSSRIQHTWMSPYTLGLESTVTLTFKKKGHGTLMTLVHSGLPDTEEGKAHIDGWEHYMDAFPAQFGSRTRKRT